MRLPGVIRENERARQRRRSCEGFSACLEGGDLIYSNYIGFQSPWHLYESGAPLD